MLTRCRPRGQEIIKLVTEQDAYLKAVNDEDIRQKLIGAGVDLLQSTPQEMAAYMHSKSTKWEKVIKAANLKVE